MQHIVTKFGGTSVSSLATWNNIFGITKERIAQGFQPVIVCSALTQISNLLEQAIQAALKNEHGPVLEDISLRHFVLCEALEVDTTLIRSEQDILSNLLNGVALLSLIPPKTHARIMSMGEIMMTRLGAAFLEKKGLRVLWLDAKDALLAKPLPFQTERMHYLSARAEVQLNAELKARLLASGADVVITQGFFVANPEGETVLLGRGGSDTSAALFAATLGASVCEIWTDVPGIYSANPRDIPQARLLSHLDYDEAQEIASMGAKVLHPNAIPPVKKARIPMVIKYTAKPEHPGTRIEQEPDANAPLIKAIELKHSISMISIDMLDHWQEVGFLADVFSVFKRHGFSVDMLSSSEYNVTVSLSANARLYERKKMDDLLAELNSVGRARLIEPCSAVSLVGNNIRAVLPQLGAVFEHFENKQIHLLSLASNDLNLTFVVDESHAEKLSVALHQTLIEDNPQSFHYSRSWEEEFGKPAQESARWWETKREKLLRLPAPLPCYVYDKQTLVERATQLKTLSAIDTLFYAMKANPNTDVLKTLYQQGIAFECVSQEELEHVLKIFPDINPSRILFTPNFAPREEYEFAFQKGIPVTLDNIQCLKSWPQLFAERELIIRIDPGAGAGHHKFVSTAGSEAKFGIPVSEFAEVLRLTKALGVKIVGLHAHSGSGILNRDLWESTAMLLCGLAAQCPHLRFINLGGGLGVNEKPGQKPLNLQELNARLLVIKATYPKLAFWLEPGRYFVSEAGVLLSRVTQIKHKDGQRFIGLDTGMNSLIRPALYGAYHEIVNLSKLHQPSMGRAHIVGPICESSDTLGYARPMPETEIGDIILIAHAGAYGHCMSSHYNMRSPAREYLLDDGC